MKKRSLSIAILCDPIGFQVGGSFRSTLRFAKFLLKKNHKIIFLAARNPSRPDIDFYEKIKVYRFFSILLPNTEKQFYIALPTKEKIKNIFVKEKIDILHIMLPTPAAIPAIKAAKDLNVKIVAHSHTQPENMLLTLPKLLRIMRLDKLFYKYMIWIYKKADVVICPSNFAEKLLKSHNKDLRTTIISNGVDILKFKKINPKSFLEKYNMDKARKRILFVGRLHPEKSVNTLIEAMPFILKHVKDAHLDIAGIGYLQESLENLTKNLNIKDNVTFFGKFSDKDLVLVYNSCCIFALPSIAELEGMVVLEAMACHKPVLIANSENSASVQFVDGNGALFRPQDPEDLAKKAVKLLLDKKLRERMSKRSYEIAKKYDINKSAAKLEKIYMNLI